MKGKIISSVITTAIIILFFLTSCDKYHRDKYTGTWEFVTVRADYNEWDGSDIMKRDTIYYTSKITLDEYERGLILQYTEWDKIVISIDKDGYIYHKAFMYGRDATGQFESKNKMYLNLYLGHYGSFEGESNYRNDHISGTKKGRR